MKLWGEIKTKLLEHRLRLVLALLLIMPLVLSFVVLYQKDNVEETYADAEIIYAKDLPLKSNVIMGSFVEDNRTWTVNWQVLALDDIDGDGINDPLLITQTSPMYKKLDTNGQSKHDVEYYLKPTTSVQEIPGQYKGTLNRYATTANRASFNGFNKRTSFFGGNGFNVQVNSTTYSTSMLEDYEWNAILVSKNKTVVSQKQANMYAYDGGNAIYVEPGTTDYSDFGNYQNAYFEYTYDKVFNAGFPEMHLAYILSGNSLNDWKASYKNFNVDTRYDTCYWREPRINVQNAFHGFLKTDDGKGGYWNNSVAANNDVAVRWCCYLNGNTQLVPNGSTYKISPNTTSSEITYATSITCYPDDMKTPSSLDGMSLVGRIDNMGNALVTERGWYIGQNENNFLDDSVVKVTVDGDNETISNKAIKVKYTGSIRIYDSYEQFVDFASLIPNYQAGDPVWIRAYVKSKLSPSGDEVTRFGVKMRVEPKSWTTPTTFTDRLITGIDLPSNMIGKPLSSNVPDESHEWTSTIKWGHFEGEKFVEETGNFESGRDYWAEIKLTTPISYGFPQNDTDIEAPSIFHDDFKYYVQNADDVKMEFIKANLTTIVAYAYFQNKTPSKLVPGNTVQMGKFNGHDLTWRVTALRDLDNDGISETPLLVLDSYLKEQDSNNPYKREFSLSGNKGDYPSETRTANGSNRYAESAIRRWLNSRNGNLTYSNALYYDDEIITDGFLSENNFSDSEFNAIRRTEIKTLVSSYEALNHSNKGLGTQSHIYDEDMADIYQNYNGSWYEETDDLVFLMGIEDLEYSNVTSGNGFSSNLGESYWLRDSKVITDDEIRKVDSGSSVTSSKANTLNAIRPALYLRNDCNLVNLGGGSYKVADNNEKEVRPASVVTGEIDYATIDSISSTKTVAASGYIENPDNVQILEVGYVFDSSDPTKLEYATEWDGNDYFLSGKSGSKVEKTKIEKRNMEYFFPINWSDSTNTYYYRAYVKSFVNGKVYTKFGNLMSYKTYKISASNKIINNLTIYGVHREVSSTVSGSQQPAILSGQWTASIKWYVQEESGEFSQTALSSSDYFNQTKTYKAEILLTKKSGYKWGALPENSFKVPGASSVTSMAVPENYDDSKNKVVVTAIFEPFFYTVGDFNLDNTISLGASNNKLPFKFMQWVDVDDDGVAEALFYYNGSGQFMRSVSSDSTDCTVSWGTRFNSSVTSGKAPYSFGSRYDLSYVRKYLNLRVLSTEGNKLIDADKYQNYYYPNSTVKYDDTKLLRGAYSIADYEYDAIKQTKWKFLLGKHEIEDLKMAEVWDDYKPSTQPSTTIGSSYLRDFYYPNTHAYYAYSTEKITTASIQELYAKVIKISSPSLSRDTSLKKSVWLRDGIGTIDNVWIIDNSGDKYSNLNPNSSANVIPCFYLEPDVILGNDPNRGNKFGILDYNKPYEDYAVSITGEPIYSKTPPTELDKIFLTGDCDNFTNASIREKGWYIGYNPSDDMDYSVVDVDTITTTAKKVKYTRDFNRTDGYYEEMVNLKELFPDYNPGDYIWIRSYVKSKCGNLPVKETYGNRIRVKPIDMFSGNVANDDYYITGLKNPANYYGKPISDYEITADRSLDWKIQEVEWGTFDGTNFTPKTGNFRQDTEYTAKITLVPTSGQAFSAAFTKDYFCVSGAKSVTNNAASSGAQFVSVYATFPNIVLQSAPDAPEVTLEKNGTTLTANWEEPDDNGAEITEYIVQLDDEDAVSVSNSTFTKTYLNVANTAHTVKVKAVNEMGESEEGTASVKPCYSIPGDSPISYWEEDIVTYVDGSETVKAEWDISQNGDNSVKAYLFNTKNSSNSYVSGDMTLVFSGSGANILDFAYAYKSGSSFASKGTAENETFTTSGYDFRTKYNGTGYITPWSWIPNLHVKHVIFADDTAFTNWDMLLCEMDELVDVTFGGESIKSPTSMQGTFRDTSNFQMNFARINTSNVTSMKRIFKGSLKEQIDLSSWSSNSLLNLDEAFANLLGCQSLTFGTSFTGSSLTSAGSLFKGGADGSALVKVDLTNAVFGNITDMSFWFSELDSLKSVKFGSSLGTSKVTNMQGMFKGCESLGLEVEGGLADKTLDLSMFNTKLVTNASSMFEGCESLEKISFGENGTFEKAENISSIFKDMSKLTELNLSKLELDSVTDYSDVFDGCTNLSKIYLPASLKSGTSIDLPSEGFLPYSQSGNIVSDITDTAHLIPKNLVGASGVEASYVKIATESDLKVNEINNASSDEAIYDIIRSEAFKSLLPDDANKTVFTGSSNDEKKIAANYLFNHIHTSGTHPYSSLEDAYEDILFSITNAETVTYETLEILPGEKGKFKVPSSLVNTNTITATYTDSSGSHSFAVTPGTDYETIVVDPTVTYTITKTLKNSTLFTDPIEIATITFANHLVLEQGDIIFEGGPFTYNGLAQYVTPKCTKYQGAEFVTTYKLKGTTSLIAKSEVIDAGTYVCETTLTGPDFIDGLKTASFEFTIEKDTFAENDKLTLEGYASSVTYKGAAYNNYALTVKLDGTLLDSSNYEITYGENINAGDGTITVSGKKNFTGFKTFTFTINPKDITNDDDIKPENLNDMEWTGSKLIPPLFDVIDEGIMIGTSPKKLTFESEFNISSYGDNIAIGDDNGSVTVTGTGNYTGTKTFTFNIVGQIIRDLSKIEVLIDDAGLVYTGNAITPADKVKVKLNGVELAPSDFEITGWENNVNANVHSTAQKAKVKVKLKGNYSSDIVSKEFTISPKELTSSDFIYNGQVITKEVSKKTDYNDQIPQSEINKISVILSGFESVKLNFTNAKFKGINPNDNPKIFGNFAIELSGLSITNKNYKLKDDFTTFNISSQNGLLVDKIKPEFSDDWATIPQGCYKAGDEIFITLKFDKNIAKIGDDPVLEFWSTNLSDGKIGTLQSGKYNARAEFVSVNNNEVKFKYVVLDGDFILNGFSFKLSGINNYSSLKDLLGNEIEFSQKEKRMDGVKIVTPDAVFEKLINEIQGNDSSSKKKEKILDILLDSDMSDAIFDDPSSGDLKSKIGTGSSNESLKEFVADYLSKITLEGTNKKEELFDEMNKAIELKSAQDEIKTNLDTYPNDKAVIDSQMIKYQKLTPNQKKNFDDTLKEKLDNLYYSNLTDDYKYKDSPQGEVNEIEMYGIVSRTSAGSDPVKLQVDRISDIERINSLQKMIKDNTSSVVDDPSKERIIAPYDIKLVRADDESVLVDIPGEKVLCRIDLPSSYYGKILNIYHKLGDDSLEKVDGKQVQLIDNKTVVYFECESFSPYFMTSDVVSVKASISDDSTSGSVNPNGLITKNYGQSQTFNFTRSGETNRVDITLLKFDESSEEFKEVEGLEPINLYKNQSFTLSNITSNMFITFKFSLDDNFKPDDNKKEEEPKGITITIGPGEFKAYMEGYSDGTFRPQNNLTRAEAATIIARISGSFSDKANYKSYATSFKDIDKDGWYLNYIGFVVSKGYMCGDSKGFRPNDPITRGEFTKLIYKLLENQMKQISISSKFTDVGGKFYQDYSNTLYSASLIKGYGDGTFKGQNAITRSEACSIINSALGRGKNKEATLNAITKSPNYKTFKDLQSFRWYYLDDMIAAVTYWE